MNTTLQGLITRDLQEFPQLHSANPGHPARIQNRATEQEQKLRELVSREQGPQELVSREQGSQELVLFREMG